MRAPGCPACHSVATARAYAVPEHDRIAFRCRDCGLTWLNQPLFIGEAAEDHYEASHSALGNAHVHIHNIRAALQGLTPPSMRLLEIGSGSGELLRLFRDQGFDVTGIEPSASGARRGREAGVRVLQSTFEAADLRETFGTAVSVHVIEHVPDVMDTLRRVCELLDQGGLCVLVTPNGDAPAFKLLGRYWAYATPEEHNQILTAEALRRFADAAGFETISTRSTNRSAPLVRGILRGIVAARRGGRLANGDAGAKEPSPDSKRREVVWSVLDAIETPLLFLPRRMLNERGLGDELITVMRKR